jgi:hypothetical protein
MKVSGGDLARRVCIPQPAEAQTTRLATASDGTWPAGVAIGMMSSNRRYAPMASWPGRDNFASLNTDQRGVASSVAGLEVLDCIRSDTLPSEAD